MSLARAVYTAALRLATPVVLLRLARRSRRQTGGADDWRARLGRGARDSRRPVWIHAASAGEVQAAAPLAAALASEYPVRLTCFTAAGRARAASLLPDLPCELAALDLPGAWRRFFARSAPRLAVLVETELWPNLLAAARAAGVPVVLVSARMTPAGARRLARVPASVREMFRALACVMAQTEEDLARFVALGLARERGRVTGNLKEALVVPGAEVERGRALRRGVLAGRRVWVAGSLREGEEEAIAEAAAQVLSAVPEAIAVLVPRHPERAPEFAAGLRARGLTPLGAEALAGTTPLPGGSVVLVARLGMLLSLYAGADAAFVGGTLAPLGGHNLLEPALLGVPVVAGPSLEQVAAPARRLRAAGALTVVNDAAMLAAAVASLLSDPVAAARQGEAARRAAGASSVLATTLAGVRALL